jgi:23S rRNA (pseudouridine1915-N3)-methyltransferase
LTFRVLAVGKASGPLADAIAEFERRAGRYWPLDIVEVRAVGARSRPADDVRNEEGARLLAKARGTIVALDERGRSMNSVAFAGWMQARHDRAEHVSFLIGGALGLSAGVLARATLRLAVAPWTLPHDLARLVLAEQVYRAGTLARGEPYHKA